MDPGRAQPATHPFELPIVQNGFPISFETPVTTNGMTTLVDKLNVVTRGKRPIRIRRASLASSYRYFTITRKIKCR
jgi:hypothetical protein